MADTTDVTTETHWLAIDIAKHWHAVLIETAAGTRHRFKMANTAQDYDRLIQFINGLGGRCRAALEGTVRNFVCEATIMEMEPICHANQRHRHANCRQFLKS